MIQHPQIPLADTVKRAPGILSRQQGKQPHSRRLAEGQVDALRPQQGVMSILQRRHAVIAQARGAAPDYDVAVGEGDAQAFVFPPQAAEQEGGGTPSETETMGWVKSRSSLSWCRDKRVPAS